MTIAKTISWRHDGKAGDADIPAADFRAWTLEVNGSEAVSVPRQWETDGQYALSTREMPTFAAAGQYTIRMKVVTRTGESTWTAPVTFTLVEAPPSPPFALAVS